ncbi:MAG: hypothetical protein ACXAB2_12565, partial [Candidatus Hodarchaeales archaeon]
TCGQNLMPDKVPENVPPPRQTARHARRKQEQDFLCFGEERSDNPYTGGIVFIFIAIFLAVIFFFDEFPVEGLVVLAFFIIGISAIVKASKENK